MSSDRIWQGWKNEPARIISWVLAIVEAIIAFGIMDLTEEQIGAMVTIIALTVGAGEGTRAKVSPADKVEEEVERRVEQVLQRRNRTDKIG